MTRLLLLFPRETIRWNIFIFRVAKWRFIKVILSFELRYDGGRERRVGQSFYPSEIPFKIRSRRGVTGLARRETRVLNSKKSRGFRPRAGRKWWYRVPNFHGIVPYVAKITPAPLSRSKTTSFALLHLGCEHSFHDKLLDNRERKSFRSFASSGRKVHDEIIGKVLAVSKLVGRIIRVIHFCAYPILRQNNR